jgi:hypothetical protein
MICGNCTLLELLALILENWLDLLMCFVLFFLNAFSLCYGFHTVMNICLLVLGVAFREVRDSVLCKVG